MLLASESRWNVPPSWDWCALADLVLFIDYRGKTPTKTGQGVRLITAKNVKKGFINISPEEFLSERDYHAWMTRGFPQSGRHLVHNGGSDGKCCCRALIGTVCSRSEGNMLPVRTVP